MHKFCWHGQLHVHMHVLVHHLAPSQVNNFCCTGTNNSVTYNISRCAYDTVGITGLHAHDCTHGWGGVARPRKKEDRD